MALVAVIRVSMAVTEGTTLLIRGGSAITNQRLTPRTLESLRRRNLVQPRAIE